MTEVILPPINVTAAAPGYSGTSNGQPFPGPNPGQILHIRQLERNSYYAKGLWREMILKIMHEQYDNLVSGLVLNGVDSSITIDLSTIQYADDYLAKNPSLTSEQAIIHVTRSIFELHQELPKASDLSGNFLTPVAALAHFVFGEGTPMVADLPSLSLRPSTTPIPQLDTALSKAPLGTSAISVDKVNYNTSNDSWITGSWLGNITLKIDGSVIKGADGSISFLLVRTMIFMMQTLVRGAIGWMRKLPQPWQLSKAF